MTQLLDPTGPYACVWDTAADACEVQNPHISEADKLCFIMGCDAPPRELVAQNYDAPVPVPAPAGGLLLVSVFVAALVAKAAQAFREAFLPDPPNSSLAAGNSPGASASGASYSRRSL